MHVPQLQRFIGKQPWDFPFVNMTEAHWEAHKLTLNERRSFRDLELVGHENNGQLFYILVSGEPVFDSKGRFCGYRGTSRDVTAARRSDQKAHLLSGLYAMLSEANHAIIHTRSIDSLYGEICRLAIEHGQFVFCRITALDGATGLTETVAQAGEDLGLRAGQLDPHAIDQRVVEDHRQADRADHRELRADQPAARGIKLQQLTSDCQRVGVRRGQIDHRRAQGRHHFGDRVQSLNRAERDMLAQS
jgi:hypothetical protein